MSTRGMSLFEPNTHWRQMSELRLLGTVLRRWSHNSYSSKLTNQKHPLDLLMESPGSAQGVPWICFLLSRALHPVDFEKALEDPEASS